MFKLHSVQIPTYERNMAIFSMAVCTDMTIFEIAKEYGICEARVSGIIGEIGRDIVYSLDKKVNPKYINRKTVKAEPGKWLRWLKNHQAIVRKQMVEHMEKNLTIGGLTTKLLTEHNLLVHTSKGKPVQLSNVFVVYNRPRDKSYICSIVRKNEKIAAIYKINYKDHGFVINSRPMFDIMFEENENPSDQDIVNNFNETLKEKFKASQFVSIGTQPSK